MQCSRQESCSRVFRLLSCTRPLGCLCGGTRGCFLGLLVHSEVLAPGQSRIPSLSVFRSPRALIFGYGCAVYVGVDVGAGDAEVNVIYITFTMSVQYIGYMVPYKDRVQVDNRTTEVPCIVLDSIL